MKYKPVTIEINDKRKYGLVAFLIDRDDFIEDINYFRHQLSIKSLISRKLLFNRLSHNIRIVKKGIEIRKMVPHDAYVEILLKKYHRSSNYKDVIIQSLYTGEVHEEDLVNDIKADGVAVYCNSTSPVYVVLPHSTDFSISQKIILKETEMAIVITPEATLKDVVKAYQQLKKVKKIHANIWLTPDTISNIIRDREWYWMHKNGMSYAEILRTTNNIERQGVIEAIKQYGKRLAIKL